MKEEPHSGWQTPTERAVADLAQRLDIDFSDLTIELVEEVTWPDGSYGCPQPGMRYVQVIIDGYRIVLSYAGQIYRYHGGVGRSPFLCEPTTRRPHQAIRTLEPHLPPSDPELPASR